MDSHRLPSSIAISLAADNTKEQFANSPDLQTQLTNAIIDALDAHTEMSSQALDWEEVQQGLSESVRSFDLFLRSGGNRS